MNPVKGPSKANPLTILWITGCLARLWDLFQLSPGTQNGFKTKICNIYGRFYRRGWNCGMLSIKCIKRSVFRHICILAKSHKSAKTTRRKISLRKFFQSTALVWPKDNSSEQNLIDARLLDEQYLRRVTVLNSILDCSCHVHFRRPIACQHCLAWHLHVSGIGEIVICWS